MKIRLLPDSEEIGWTPYAWLIYIVPFATTPWLNPAVTPLERMASLVATLTFVALYFRSYWARGSESLLIVAAMVLLGIACWRLDSGAGAFFIYAASVAGSYQSARLGIRLVIAIAAIALLFAWLFQKDAVSAAWPFVFTIIIGGINIHYAQVGRSNSRLRLAHDEIAHLAKVAERERIARDLHDLLGHTLSVIILKSELASKLAERDVERARKEIRDVEQISRDALTQVRSAVRGYRSGGLHAELEAARAALGAAGVALQGTLVPLTLAAAQEAVLALAIRECVTNVIRHAEAKNCRITLAADSGSCTLTMVDDGRGGLHSFGAGLLGMRERVEALSGTMVREGGNGTTIEITLPCEELPSPAALLGGSA